MKKIQGFMQIVLTIGLLTISAFSQSPTAGSKNTPPSSTAKTPFKTTVKSAGKSNSPPVSPRKFVSEEGRLSIKLPPGFVGFKRHEFGEPSSAPDEPTRLVQYFSYPNSTPANLIDTPPNYVLVMYLDYPDSVTKAGYNSELLEISHKSTFRKFPEFNITGTERNYWNAETGIRIPTARLDDSEYTKKFLYPSITTYGETADHTGHVRFDSYLVNGRIYELMGLYTDRKDFGQDSLKAFFDSFRVSVGKK